MPDVLKRAQAAPLGAEMQEQASDEHKRLLYVSCTRARDVMVLTSHRRRMATAWTDTIGASKLLFAQDGDIMLEDDTTVRRHQRAWSHADIAATPPMKLPLERRWLVPRMRQQHLPLWLRPSSMASGAYQTEGVEVVGTRIPLKVKVDMASLGSAVHNSIAYCLASSGGASKEIVSAILQRWGIGAAVAPEDVVAQADALLRWVEGKWHGSPIWTEVPVEVKLASGRVVRGQIDLLVDLGNCWILIDHKSDPRSASDGGRLAHTHGAQLEAYAEAVAAGTGRRVAEKWLFLPVAAQAVKVGEAAASIASPELGAISR
jgi:ATP-dependent exoDNAse (exonuclease V) beta subunit